MKRKAKYKKGFIASNGSVEEFFIRTKVPQKYWKDGANGYGNIQLRNQITITFKVKI